MEPTTRRAALTAAAAAILPLAPLRGLAQQARGVTSLVVPQAPGGVVDLVTRAFADHFSQQNVPAIAVNKPGAAGEVAATFVAAAPADGTTLLVGNSSTMVVAPQVKKTRYDPVKDFRALGGIVVADTILVTNKATGITSLDDLVRHAKANPGKLAYGSNGVGGAFHLAMEYFQFLTGTKMLHVPFNGAAPAEMALVGNQVGVMVANTGPSMAHIRNGTLVPLAVVGSRPSIELPDLVLASRVIPNFVANTWVGVYAPAGLPDAKAAQVNGLLEQFARSPKGEAFLKSRGLIPVAADLQEAAQWTASEMRSWAAIVAEARKNGPIE